MFNNLEDFYPTPLNLIHKLLSKVDFKYISNVLEPSGGKGDLAEAILEKMKSVRGNSYNREEIVCDLDIIEINTDLQYILKGKKFRVVHDNFLTYETYKTYSAIIANFPFSEGCKHALKSLDMIKQGGQLVAILNAETLRNTYSNERKDLMRKLTDLNAEIEYIESAFEDAERKTSVEIAIINVKIEKTNRNSVILDNLKQEEQFRKENSQDKTIISSDFIDSILERYNFEMKAGINLINEYLNLLPLTLKSFEKNSSDSTLILKTSSDQRWDGDHNLINRYVKIVRYKYWKALFNSEKFSQLLTTNLLNDYRNKVTELQDYDFSRYNIEQIQLQMNQNVLKGVEDTILELFEDLSHKVSWYAETSKNILHFNGWKTNKAWKINKRVIFLLSGYGWTDRLEYTNKVFDKLKDIEKSLNYLDGGLTEEMDLRELLINAQNKQETRNIELKHFSITFYKKGTCHLTFKSEDLLSKLNIFGSQRKGFLPPSYGKVKYDDMTTEEQEVINQFQGKESYEKVIKNTDYYLYNPSKTLMLQG